MARVNIEILEIIELKWTGMDEFNSDYHYIYYCWQESLRRNGVDLIDNKRVRNAVQSSRSVVFNSLRTMNCSTPSLPVHHQLLEFTQTHVH